MLTIVRALAEVALIVAVQAWMLLQVSFGYWRLCARASRFAADRQELQAQQVRSAARAAHHPQPCLGSIGQTLEGSFSAVSKRNFARKYAVESSRRDLHNALLCTALQS